MMSHSLVKERNSQQTPLLNANLQLPAGPKTGATFSENWNVKLGDILRPLLAKVWLP